MGMGMAAGRGSSRGVSLEITLQQGRRCDHCGGLSPVQMGRQGLNRIRLDRGEAWLAVTPPAPGADVLEGQPLDFDLSMPARQDVQLGRCGVTQVRTRLE